MSCQSAAKLFIVDDHPMVRDGLINLLQGAGFAIIGTADGAPDALAHAALPESDLVLVDLTLGDESGIALMPQLLERGLKVLVYSMHEEANVIRKALEIGASGYVTKREASGPLLDAVRAVLGGSRFLSPRASKALDEAMPIHTLTGQQDKIYRLMGQGLTNEEIARQLGISVRTLESYCVRIMDKLGVHGIKDLRRKAIQSSVSVPGPP